MRLALVINQLAPGGAEVQVVMLARHLRAAGHHVSVVSLLPGTALASELEADRFPVCSIDIRSTPLSISRLVAFCNRERPQIAHAHLFHSNVAIRLLRLVCPFPIVISTIHSVAESRRDAREVKARDLAYRWTNWLADATVCVSQAAADRHLRDRAVTAQRLRVIPNGVDTDRFRPDRDLRIRTRAELGIGDEFIWVAAGRLIWKKNYSMMLRALAQCGTGTLLIAGTGPDERQLRATVDELGVRTRFLGSVSDMPALMNAADAFLLTSDVEGLPVALLEAGASGLPAIATDVGGVAEVIEDGVTGHIVPPGDVSAFAAGMRRLAASPTAARKQMGSAARARVVQCFDIRAIVRRWIDLYEELLER